MRKFTENLIALPMLMAVAASTVVSPIREANALVGLIVSSTPTIVVGGLLTAVGAGDVLYVYAVENGSVQPDDALVGLFWVLTTILFLPAGGLILDAQNGQNVTFQEVQPADALKAGLTQAELDAYNFEAVDRMNLLSQEAASAIAAAPKGAENAASAAAWDAGLKELSPEAFSAVHKLFSKRIK